MMYATLIFCVNPSGSIRQAWNDTVKISMAPTQGEHTNREVSIFV